MEHDLLAALPQADPSPTSLECLDIVNYLGVYILLKILRSLPDECRAVSSRCLGKAQLTG